MKQAVLQPSDAPSNAGRFSGASQPHRDARLTPLAHWHERRHRQDLFERFALTFERVGDLSGKRGLDVGCGTGHYVLESLRRGAAHVVGIDTSLGTLELLRRQIEAIGQTERVELLHGYFPTVSPEGAFDFALAIGVLDYVDEPLPFLKALRNAVRGASIVTFPSRHWLLTPLRRLRHWLRGSRLYCYREPEILALCRQAGFERIEIEKLDGAGLDYHVRLTS